MIENEFQLRITLDNIRRFKDALDVMPDNESYSPLLIQAYRNGVISMLETLEDEVKEYRSRK